MGHLQTIQNVYMAETFSPFSISLWTNDINMYVCTKTTACLNLTFLHWPPFGRFAAEFIDIIQRFVKIYERNWVSVHEQMIYTNANITQPPSTYQICHTHKVFNEYAAVKFTDVIESYRWRTRGCNIVELHLPLTHQQLEWIF